MGIMVIDNTEVTLSLRADLLSSIKHCAEKEGKKPEEFMVEGLWKLRQERGEELLAQIHEGWHLRMMRLGLFSEDDLFRYLES
jgi:hypothetical protein